MEQCPDTPGWIATGGDCDDAEPNAHPGVEAFSALAHSGSFDWNCDGTEERDALPGPLASCRFGTTVCAGDGDDAACGTSGWFDDDVACGEETLREDCDCQEELSAPGTFGCERVPVSADPPRYRQCR
jgi:hypothetical protein